jgi:hypothetical protein
MLDIINCKCQCHQGSKTSSSVASAEGQPVAQLGKTHLLHSHANVGVGYNLQEIAAIDLTKFRKAELPSSADFLILLPVVGWIALFCLGLANDKSHAKGEAILNEGGAYAHLEVGTKVTRLTQVIQQGKSHHSWQYRLERAKQHMLNQHFEKALEDIEEVRKFRGVYHREIGHFRPVEKYFHSTEEAYLAASIFAANNRFSAAAIAYNESRYFNHQDKEQVGLEARAAAHESALNRAIKGNVQQSFVCHLGKLPCNWFRWPHD